MNLVQALGAPLALRWMRGLRLRDPETLVLPESGILALWHEHMLLCLPVFAHRHMRVLVSQSRDGDLGAYACERLGYAAVRGSSSRGGASALRALARELSTQGGWAALIVDGPRGPRRQAKPGAVWLSRHTGLPVTAVYAVAARGFHLRNWDRTFIPFPGAKIRMRLSKPFSPASVEELERGLSPITTEFEAAL